MTETEHKKAVEAKQREITKLRNASKGANLSLAEKLIMKERVKVLECDLRQFKLDFYQLVTKSV